MRELILASASPRRRELLSSLGLHFEVVIPDVDETIITGESPEQMVERIARLKAQKISDESPMKTILAADTTVAIAGEDGGWEILAKPSSVGEAEEMLGKLSGRTHSVFTGYSIHNRSEGLEVSAVVQTEVTFDRLSKDEIAAYVATGEPMDKAGAYGIQGFGARLVSSISGSYTNVVGLPLCEVCRDLERFGIRA